MRLPRFVLAAAAAAAVAGSLSCAARPVPVDGAPPDPDSAAARKPFSDLTGVWATLIVETERPVDYRIYLTRQGGERLGFVRGPGRSRFLLRGTQMPPTGDLRVIGVPMAENGYVVGSANIPRGRTARFRIMPNDAYIIVEPLPIPKDSTESDSTAKADSTRKP